MERIKQFHVLHFVIKTLIELQMIYFYISELKIRLIKDFNIFHFLSMDIILIKALHQQPLIQHNDLHKVCLFIQNKQISIEIKN